MYITVVRPQNRCRSTVTPGGCDMWSFRCCISVHVVDSPWSPDQWVRAYSSISLCVAYRPWNSSAVQLYVWRDFSALEKINRSAGNRAVVEHPRIYRTKDMVSYWHTFLVNTWSGLISLVFSLTKKLRSSSCTMGLVPIRYGKQRKAAQKCPLLAVAHLSMCCASLIYYKNKEQGPKYLIKLLIDTIS